MSPENDQTRWIGIRPTNPPEDIPVTLDAEVVHVIVDSGGGGGLVPGAPIIVTFYQAASVDDMWYTIAEVDPGAGHIQKIHIGGNLALANIDYRITIDGATITYTPTLQDALMYQDLANASNFYKEVPFYLLRYEEDFKVEIRQTFVNGKLLYGLVSYIPDPP